jgi:Flp pilus assembly protein TadD
MRCRGPRLAVGLILLLPSSSIFPAADLAADRRMYLPLACFAVAAAMWLARVKRPAALGTVLVAVLALVSVTRTYVWASDARLWREAVRRAPNKVRPKIQLSRAVSASEGLELLTQAAIQSPYDPAVAAETGRVFLDEHQPEAALREFGRALALDPRNAQNYNNRGVALQELGQSAAARMDFERALQLDPHLAEARENLEKLTGVP